MSPQELTEVNGLGQQDPSAAPTEEPSAEPSTEPHAPSPKKGMAARNARNRKQPEKYVPSMKGNKYAVALTQIAACVLAERQNASYNKSVFSLGFYPYRHSPRLAR